MSSRVIIILILFTCVIFDVKAQVGIITTIGGSGTTGYGGDGGPATNAAFNTPYQLCFYQHNIYVADAFNHRVRKIDINTGIISTIAGTDTSGYNGDNIAATSAQLLVPEGICTDSTGNIYIADGGNYRVRKISVVTGLITTIAGTGIDGHTGDGGAATAAHLHPPGGLSFDRAGNLFFADGNHVRKITPAGLIYTIAGKGTMGYSGDNGPATSAELNLPNKATVDTLGNVIITEGRNRVLRRVDMVTGIITTIAGNGILGYSGDDGPATNSVLGGVSGGFIDGENSFYFSQWDNGVIRKIDGATGIITTVVGCGLQGFSGDGGPATNAKLMPSDVCIGSFDIMYVLDADNSRVRMVYNPQLSVILDKVTNHEIKVYPNPANDELNIAYKFVGNEDAMLQIMNVMGRAEVIQTLYASKEKDIVDIHALSPGIYIYKVIQDRVVIGTGKVVKE